MTTEERSWFERNQGLITFLGYLLTVIIMAIALYYVYLKSTETLSLTKTQIRYEKSRDSLNGLRDAKREAEYNGKFNSLDSVNKHQDSVSSKRFGYLKKRIDFTQGQLNKLSLTQANQNKNQFLAQEFVMDSVVNKPARIRYRLYNTGKTTSVIKRVTVFLWNRQKHLVISPTPINGLTVEPEAYSNLAINLPANYEAKLKLFPVVLIQVFFEDAAMNGLQLNRVFFRFSQYNPVEVVEVDEKTQQAMLNYIQKFKKGKKMDYLNLSFDGSSTN